MITAGQIAEAVRSGIPTAASTLRPDVAQALQFAQSRERSERGRAVISQLLENAELAASQTLPLCQDTGTVWVRVEIGADETLTGDVAAEVDRAVAAAYAASGLRMSLVHDALLDRSNTGNNTPAFVELAWREGSGATVSVMLKGGGSDNASRVVMLPPEAGFQGVRQVVIDAVLEKATAACPPLLLGVGVGTTFDKVGALSKRALLRRIGAAPSSPKLAEFEQELLAAVNATGIGPAGLGGDTTALAVHVETAPCHIAALPVAVNMGCCAVRSVTLEVGR